MFAAVGQRAAEDPITPVSAPPTKKGGWQPVSTFQGLIGISGGFCRKPLGAQSIEWTSGNKTHRFVELAKNAEWFLKGVGGAKTQKGDLKAVTVLDEIRDKLNSTAEPSAVAGPSAVADSDDDDAPDPMDAVLGALQYDDDDDDEVPDTLIKATKKAVRTPQKKTARSMVTEPSAVAGPSAVADGDDRSETTTVCLYLKPNNRNIKSASIYIRVDCIDWLLSYAADELFHSDTAADEDLHVANCPAVADVNLEWDFATHAWEAEFLAGPFQGVTRSFGIADLTAERLAKLRDVGIGQPDPRSPTSALPTKKQVAKEFITLWCDAICKERDSFETDWELSTATKRRRVAS